MSGAGLLPSQAPPRLRVLFFLRLRPGAARRFLDAYERVRLRVARVPGHLHDQVCQSLHDPEEWLITSEWESERAFLDWERTPEHRQDAAPMLEHTVERRSQRFLVRAATSTPLPWTAGERHG